MPRNSQLKFTIGFILLICIGFTSVSGALATEDVEQTNLTTPDIYWRQVQQIVEIGLKENRMIRISRNEEGIARQQLRQSRLFENPTLSTQFDRRGGNTDRERMISLDIPLPIDGRRGASVNTAKAGVEESRFRTLNEERLLAKSIRIAIADVVASRMRLGLLRSSLTLAENNQRLTARSVEEGLRAPLDLNREVVFVNGLRVKVEIAESELAEVESRLCILLSRETLEGLELPAALPSARLESINAKVLHEFAVERRPDVLEKRAGIRIAKGLLGQERAERRPRVDLMLGLRDMTAGFPFTAIDMNGNLSPIEDRMRFSAVGFKIGLPLFNWNQGNISAAKIEVESRGESTSQAELEVRNELDAAISRFNRTSRSLELMIRGVATQARENLRVVRIAYNEGAMSLDEFLREQRALIDVELDLIDVARLNSITEAELIASVGVASFSELMQAIQSGRTK